MDRYTFARDGMADCFCSMELAKGGQYVIYYERLDKLEAEKRAAEAEAGKQICLNTELETEVARLRRDLDNLKVRAYELGQKELHDMAWKALQEQGE